MVATENHNVKYFRAPDGDFWYWADNGTVVSWIFGHTICYRDDLLSLLRQVNSGMPPLSPLLLLIAACREKLPETSMQFFMRKLRDFQGTDQGSKLHKTVKYALAFLDTISLLPENLRTGQKRMQLIYEVFSGVSFTIDNNKLQAAIDEFDSGRIDNEVFHSASEKITEEDFTNCLLYFCIALQKYPDVQSLTLKLRTGLDQVPAVIPQLLPETETGSLYDQLLQDTETAGIARLAKRLTAALKIPMQSKGSSDQPFGGISDISNRGNYDKLLLSELAHDDDVLMARLVNNEALYFRREEPPENPKMQRIILLDTTLKMWGTARVFALASGLAAAQQNKRVELGGAYTLGGTVFTAVSLNSKHGIVQALEKLDPALHCGPAVEEVIASIPFSTKNEFIFITHARLLQEPGFYAYFSKVKQKISFIITVTETGELHLYECINGVSKQISHAKIDLDELLTVQQKPAEKTRPASEDAPAFVLQKISPLYFAAIRVKPYPESFYIDENFGAVAVNETQRVFFRREKDRGVTELLSYIEKGTYTIGVSSDNVIQVLVINQQRKLVKLYSISSDDFDLNVVDLAMQIELPTVAFYKDNKFHIEGEFRSYVYDCIACVVVDKKPPGTFRTIMQSPGFAEAHREKMKLIYSYFNDYENIFYKVKEMYVNKDGQLVLGKHVFCLWHKDHVSFRENSDSRLRQKTGKIADHGLNFLNNKHLSFVRWVWDDGSEATVDPRGLLHLKSSDTALPEISIVMVLGGVTACWASDNSACGNIYYINKELVNIKTPEDFYQAYIQKFIDRLI